MSFQYYSPTTQYCKEGFILILSNVDGNKYTWLNLVDIKVAKTQYNFKGSL